MGRVVSFCFILVVLFTACTPQTEEAERVSIDQFAGSVSFYPQETGIVWSYVPPGGSLESPALQQVIEGPTVLNDDIWIASSVTGVGLSGFRFRQYRSDGVYRLRETAPGVETTYDPPIREFPAESELVVGASWTGDTTATVFFPGAKPDEQTQVQTVNYTYTVVDKRTVNNLPIGPVEVFVVNLVGRLFDADGGISQELKQEVWFAPFIGEVRTREGFLLIATNTVESEPVETE